MVDRLKVLNRQLIGKFHRIYYFCMRVISSYSIFSHRAESESESESESEFELVFVIQEGQRGWILEGVALEIANYYHGEYHFHYSIQNLPKAKAYFFMHYATMISAYRKNPSMWHTKVFTYYTHPRSDYGYSDDELYFLLSRASRIFCMCSAYVKLLEDRGISTRRLGLVIGGADPKIFQSHTRRGGKIGFCTAYYDRKNPEMILKVIKNMPHREFMLIGRNWQNYSNFDELMGLPNFEYIEAEYEQYPSLYTQMDVFVSVSKLEGGPIPLIEAMMSNVVPVASRTGFAPDLINYGENGYLFDTDASVVEICELIEKALNVNIDIRATVKHCSWEIFSNTMQNEMKIT